MIKYIQLILFLLLSILSFAQKSNVPSWGIHTSYSKFQSLGNDNFEILSSSKYSLGIDVFNHISSTREYSTGFRYKALNFNYKDYSLSFNCDGDVTLNSNNSWIEGQHLIQYFSVPLGIIQKSNSTENHFYFKAELELLLEIKSTLSLSIHECGTNILEIPAPLQNRRNDFLLSTLAIGYQRQLFNTKFKLRLEPRVSLTMNKFKNSHALLTSDGLYSYFYGLNIGLRI